MIELAFKLGFEYGRRYESLFEKSGLYNGIEIDFESLAIASKAGAMQSTLQGEPKNKALHYESIAFEHCNKEMLAELEKLVREKQETLKMLLESGKQVQTKLF